MGAVHAKSPTMNMANSQQDSREVDLANVPAKVLKVHVDGLKRTKNDFVVREVKDILKSDNFEDMIKRSYEAKTRLDQLGVFKNIGIYVDTCKDSRGGSTGYEVTLEVEETRRVTGGVNTLVGTNEGSLMLGMKCPNVFGRAERLSLEYTYGSKNSGGTGISFVKPIRGDPNTLFTAGIFENHAEYPWSGYRGSDRGIGADIQFLSALGSHSLRWEGVWRELACLSGATSFPVRENMGNSLKSAVKHTLVRDQRDDPIIPNTGTLLRFSQELAGLGGDTEFVKADLELQYNKPLPLDSVLQLSLAGGCMRPLFKREDQRPLRINDRFFLGGPLTLRGFNLKGIGPSRDGNALGANAYWLAGAHLYTPLPFRPSKGGFGDLFRSHFFFNAGNLGTVDLAHGAKHNVQLMSQDLRLSVGAGIVLRMGRVARMELNYCWPLRLSKGDSVNKGLQFGIGVHFL